MKSKEGEIVYFNKNVNVGGQPEVWLSAVQKEMKEALLKKLKEGYKDYINANGKNTKREEWVCLHPAQVVTTIGMVRWCTETEETILAMPENPMALAEAYENNVNQLKHLTTHIRRTDLTELLRTTLVALITQDVHARDIVEIMRKNNVMTTDEFAWQQQLRFYWKDEDSGSLEANPLTVQQIQATLNYGYEYMGATTRLVITPLTDKCWITITGALHIKLGANPAGPAGTGKTESTKDLAKAIAIYCVVYNCSDQVDYLMM